MVLPLIKVVQVTVTNRCQCNCIHCGVSNLREVIKKELTANEINRLFQDLNLAGCQVVDLFGGEPTLRGDLCQIIALGKHYGFFMSLETNGYSIDQDYMDRLVESGLDQIYLSLDSYRAEDHDRIRRKRGCFDRAIRALDFGSKTGIRMHVSTVPQSRDFFLNGDVNRFMQFVMDHGAEQVRLLLPRYVGESVREDSGPVCAGEEKELFSHVSEKYHDFIYLHTPGTPLGEKNLCTAKQVFCHVMSNGWVAPCPYFPLVFGDATQEPILDIFERIQSHPLVRLGDDFCPMRNEEYINTHIRSMGATRPFFPIKMKNQIDLGSTCTAGCFHCAYGLNSDLRSIHEVIDEIENVDSKYTRMEFYGGNPFLRNELFSILDRVPGGRKIVLWTTCDISREDWDLLERLRSYPVEAIKLCIPPIMHERINGSGGDLEIQDLFALVKRWSRSSLPIHLYVPLNLIGQFQTLSGDATDRLGVQRLYGFTKDVDQAPVNSVGCFGAGVGQARLVWIGPEQGLI